MEYENFKDIQIMEIDLAGSSVEGSWWKTLNDIILEYSSTKTGPFEPLIINIGGIQNRITKKQKEKFKISVLPTLMAIACLEKPITGKIEGHLAQGVLQNAKLIFQCERGHIVETLF